MLRHKLFIWHRSNHYGVITNFAIALFIISTIYVIDNLEILFVSVLASLVLSYYSTMMLWQVLLNTMNLEFLPNLKSRNDHVYEVGLYPRKRKDVTDEK